MISKAPSEKKIEVPKPQPEMTMMESPQKNSDDDSLTDSEDLSDEDGEKKPKKKKTADEPAEAEPEVEENQGSELGSQDGMSQKSGGASLKEMQVDEDENKETE